MRENESAWWESFHVIEMADVFLQRSSSQEIRDTCDFLIESLALSKGNLVFDQCCGTGTLSFELAKNGIRTVGVDICEAYIERANQRRCESDFAECKFVRGDAFQFVSDDICDGVFNWYSSFGYAPTNEKNSEMLARAFQSLKPGGCFALDVPNFPSILRNFQKYLMRTGQSNGREVTCVRESHINLQLGLLEQQWNWHVEGRKVDTRRSALRLYFPHEISELLISVGFDSVQLFGGTDRSNLELDSPRLIAVARKSQ